METIANAPNPTHPQRVTPQTLRLLHDYVLVRPLAPPVKKAGSLMFMPESAGERERNSRGIVIAVGPGDWNQVGTGLLPMDLEPGALVFFGKYAGTEEEFDGAALLVMRETEVRLSVPAGQFLEVTHDNPKLNHLVEDWCDVCYGDPEAEAKANLELAREELRDEVSPLREAARTREEIAARDFDPLAPAEDEELHGIGSLDLRAPRRPCVEPGCSYVQTYGTASGVGPRLWVGRICGHQHPASLEA